MTKPMEDSWFSLSQSGIISTCMQLLVPFSIPFVAWNVQNCLRLWIFFYSFLERGLLDLVFFCHFGVRNDGPERCRKERFKHFKRKKMHWKQKKKTKQKNFFILIKWLKKKNRPKPNPCSCVQKFMIRIYYMLYLILPKCLFFFSHPSVCLWLCFKQLTLLYIWETCLPWTCKWN